MSFHACVEAKDTELASTRSWRTVCPARHRQNVSVCPILRRRPPSGLSFSKSDQAALRTGEQGKGEKPVPGGLRRQPRQRFGQEIAGHNDREPQHFKDMLVHEILVHRGGLLQLGGVQIVQGFFTIPKAGIVALDIARRMVLRGGDFLPFASETPRLLFLKEAHINDKNRPPAHGRRAKWN